MFAMVHVLYITIATLIFDWTSASCIKQNPNYHENSWMKCINQTEEIISSSLHSFCPYNVEIEANISLEDILLYICDDTKYLTLKRVKLAQEKSKIGLVGLEYLTITHSSLSVLKENSITHLTNLRYLNLSFVGIKTIEQNSLFGMKNLKDVILSHNKLSNLNLLGVVLRTLKIDHNSLTNLSSLNIAVPFKLVELDVSFNNIHMLEKNSLRRFKFLQYLYLQNNVIDSFPMGLFDGLNNLEVLNISFNNVDTVPAGVFSGLSKLKVLDISSNKIKYITGSSINGLRLLKSLNISSNMLTTFSKDFLEQLNEGLTISLDRNQYICNDLLNFITQARKKHIYFIPGNTTDLTNIFNIRCVDSTSNLYSNEPIDTDNQKHKDKIILFNSDLKNSEFYSFFKNYANSSFARSLNNGFIKSKLYQFFTNDFLATPFFKFFQKYYFNETFYKTFKDKVNLNEAQNTTNNNLLNIMDEMKSILLPEALLASNDKPGKNNGEQLEKIFILLVFVLLFLGFILIFLIFSKINAGRFVRHLNSIEMNETRGYGEKLCPQQIY